MTGRYLVLSASMGGGHDGTATELARRLAAHGARVRVVDLLTLLPAGSGRLMRAGYSAMLRRTPGLYEHIYQRFQQPDEAMATVEATVRLALPAVRRLVAGLRPDAVIGTFHLAAAVTGRLRALGRLPSRSIVLLTEFAPHLVWLAPGNDAYLCLSPGGQEIAARTVGNRAVWAGPLVRSAFADPPPATPPGRPLVVLCAGSWGVADHLADSVRALRASGRYFPLAVCGRNARLRAAVARAAGDQHATGWVDDMPGLLSAAYALVDNSGGLTCTEAFRTGTPVVIRAPLPGHGVACADQLAAERLVLRAGDGRELVNALDAIPPDGPARRRQVARAAALFRPDVTDLILTRATTHPTNTPTIA